MRRNLIIYLVFITVVVAGCSTYSSNPIGSSYHNLTAHYNAYFIANERMKEIETSLYEGFQWNYNKVLPIYVPVDSNDAKSLEEQINDCVEKASIAIQRHEGSRWEDDSYVLVGKARYYALEYADAIETFKYVNKEGEDDDARHEALIELIKTFVDFNEINNAIVVSDFLKKEDLSSKNRRELSMARAYLYQKRDDLDQLVKHLVEAEALMNRGQERARIDFIIGQVYQQLGFEAEAYNYYQSCLKNGPEYELEFYTKLNMAQVSELTSSGDVKKIRKYFRKLLKDTKNKEYKDKIYYEMANFELKQGNLNEAIGFYKESVQTSVNNQRQKAYSYLKLGQIYYDSLKNFELAQAYYDSTVTSMPKDEDGYEKIKQRQEVLDDFVKQITIIRTNDSLISLSNLPSDSLMALATSVAEEEAAKEEEKRKKEERRKENIARNSSFDTNSGDLIGTNPVSGATWYFYSSSALGRGASEFKRLWGDRPLEDNWRRSTKSGADAVAQSTKSETETLDASETTEDNIQGRIDELIASVPKSQDQIDQMLGEVEVALYELGNIYNFQLEEKSNAIQTFESLLIRFPNSEYEAEVLYQLYLLYKDGNESLAQQKAAILKEKFPDSIYSKLIDNPRYREDSQLLTEKLKKVYTRAYELYNSEEYALSQSILDSALQASADNNFKDNLALLRVLNIGKQEGQYKYQYELNNFIKNYPDSDLLTYAQSLLKASEDYQINLYNSAKAKFVEYFDQRHYIVIVYPNKDDLSQGITTDLDEFIKSKNLGLTTGNLILDETNALVLINDFPGKSSAKNFLKLMQAEISFSDKYKGEKIYTFAITEDNFNIFYQTRDVNAYLNFFDKHYK
ncbi:tetratricopeptide repeat protein [Marinoscillum sp.]|uniref:type IX secretion system periplasmic lipoprotein PorW/SprE n=1 Tax=Marinoscillum sp. TaxID=2024838 RepID=UPI003BAB9457